MSMVYMSFMYTMLDASTISIEQYEPSRDSTTVQTILNENHELLTYEAMGYPEGTTFKYLTSHNYITDVIRVDGITIGFANYCAFNIEFCTFHFARRGFIHLIGIDRKYQHQGYGALLLDHTLIEFKKLHVPVVEISVQSTNIPALKLYEKKGFVKVFDPPASAQPVPLLLRYTIDIPAHELPQGNIIQRHPRITLGCCIAAIVYFGRRKYIQSLHRLPTSPY
jgi:ribosomal protein S18 acetylase RimI-like enzyme